MDSGGIPSDWKPSPPPEVGSWAWKRNTAISYAIENGMLKNVGTVERIVRLPVVMGYDLGYLAIRRSSGGYDYIYGEEIVDG